MRDPRVRFHIGDARQLPVESGRYDAAISGLVLNFIPDPAKTLAEMTRVVRPAAVVAGYVWDYAANGADALFLGRRGRPEAQFPAPEYAMMPSDEERAVLRDRLRARLPTGADGSISLLARAWAARGYH